MVCRCILLELMEKECIRVLFKESQFDVGIGELHHGVDGAVHYLGLKDQSLS